MINKIIEKKLDGTQTVLLDVSEVTAGKKQVAKGYRFVNNQGELFVGEALVGANIYKDITPKIECCRFRSIPTKNEYEEFYNGGETPVAYESIYPVFVENTGNVDSSVVYGNKLEEFKVANTFKYPVYDNKCKGYVVSTITLTQLLPSEISTLGISQADYSLYSEVVQAMHTKFSKFVLPTDFAYSRTVITDDKVFRGLDITTSGSLQVDTIHPIIDGYGWTRNAVGLSNLRYRLYNVVIRQTKLLYSAFLFEMSKFLAKKKLMNESNTQTNVTNLINAMAQLRSANHIDTSTLMTSANTPEIITGKTPQEVLNTYMSSLFKTDTNREDDYTSAYEKFEDMFDELVTRVAFACLIPN